ncbi:hypothetical protein Bca4012_051242 [Brassica carinata]
MRPYQDEILLRRDQEAEIYRKDNYDARLPCSSGNALHGNVEGSLTSFSPLLPQKRIPDETHLKTKPVVSRLKIKEGKGARSETYQQTRAIVENEGTTLLQRRHWDRLAISFRNFSERSDRGGERICKTGSKALRGHPRVKQEDQSSSS